MDKNKLIEELFNELLGESIHGGPVNTDNDPEGGPASIYGNDIDSLKHRVNEKDTKSKQEILKLFKLQISENWGKLDTVERDELQRVVYAATAGKKTVQERLSIVQEQMTNLRDGVYDKIKNPRRFLSQIILLETFNRLFKSFQPSPAGFINEGLLSVFYGSTQEDAGEANKEFQIGDVIDPDNTPISIKTKISGKAEVDGSIKNLYKSLNGSKTGKVYFDIFLKKITGSGDKKQVGSLTFYRFTVDGSNINDFLNKDLFDPDPENPGRVVLKKKYAKTHLGESLNSLKEDLKTDEVRELIYSRFVVQRKDNPENKELLPTEENLANAFSLDSDAEVLNFLSKHVGGKNWKSLQRPGDDLPDREERTYYRQVLSQLTKMYNKARKRADVGYSKSTDGKEKIHTEFSLNESDWMRFALSQGELEDPIVLTFSDAEIMKTIEAAVAIIDVAITDMFNSLATFTQTVQTYLTTIASNRASIGRQATDRAKELPEKTDAVVEIAADKPGDKNTLS